jgi:hypothetical protein
MKKMILALALVMSQTSAFASDTVRNPDEMVPFLSCSSPLRDAGYSVILENGGLVPHTSASVSETTIAGGNVLLSVPMVTVLNQASRIVYVDSETNGQEFSLVYSVAVFTPSGRMPLNALLTANTKAGRISVQLQCVPMDRRGK